MTRDRMLCRLSQLIKHGEQCARLNNYFGIDVDLVELASREPRFNLDQVCSAPYAAAATTFATSTNVSENVGALP
jgi:hypothetical protein